MCTYTYAPHSYTWKDHSVLFLCIDAPTAQLTSLCSAFLTTAIGLSCALACIRCLVISNGTRTKFAACRNTMHDYRHTLWLYLVLVQYPVTTLEYLNVGEHQRILQLHSLNEFWLKDLCQMLTDGAWLQVSQLTVALGSQIVLISPSSACHLTTWTPSQLCIHSEPPTNHCCN